MLTNFNFLKVLLGLTLYIQQAKNKKKNFDIVSYRTRKRICFIHTVLLENKLERLYKSLYLCLSVSFQSKLFLYQINFTVADGRLLENCAHDGTKRKKDLP